MDRGFVMNPRPIRSLFASTIGLGRPNSNTHRPNLGAQMRTIARAIFVAVGVASEAPAFAADLPTKKPAPAPIPEPVLPSNWHFELTAYGWATSLVGEAGVAS